MGGKSRRHPNIHAPKKIFGDIWVIKCVDYVDSTNSHALDSAISDLLSEGKNKILVDFTELNFITSDVPNTLIGHVGSAREKGGDILLLKPMQNIMDIIELLGLGEIFNIALDESAAMNHFRHIAAMGVHEEDTREMKAPQFPPKKPPDNK